MDFSLEHYEFSKILHFSHLDIFVFSYPYQSMFVCVKNCASESLTGVRQKLWILQGSCETPEVDAGKKFVYSAYSISVLNN